MVKNKNLYIDETTQVTMNIKSRLERVAESKQWIRVYFHDGSGIAGKVLRVGQDYVEIESYGFDDSPDSRNYAKNLIPLSFIKMFTVESSNFAEAERKRLEYLSQIEDLQQLEPISDGEK